MTHVEARVRHKLNEWLKSSRSDIEKREPAGRVQDDDDDDDDDKGSVEEIGDGKDSGDDGMDKSDSGADDTPETSGETLLRIKLAPVIVLFQNLFSPERVVPIMDHWTRSYDQSRSEFHRLRPARARQAATLPKAAKALRDETSFWHGPQWRTGMCQTVLCEDIHLTIHTQYLELWPKHPHLIIPIGLLTEPEQKMVQLMVAQSSFLFKESVIRVNHADYCTGFFFNSLLESIIDRPRIVELWFTRMLARALRSPPIDFLRFRVDMLLSIAYRKNQALHVYLQEKRGGLATKHTLFTQEWRLRAWTSIYNLVKHLDRKTIKRMMKRVAVYFWRSARHDSHWLLAQVPTNGTTPHRKPMTPSGVTSPSKIQCTSVAQWHSTHMATAHGIATAVTVNITTITSVN